MNKSLAALALILGGLAAFAGSPYPRPKEVTATQLMQWIKEHKPGLQIIDMRSKAEFDAFHVPTSRWRQPVGSGSIVVVVTNDLTSVAPDSYVLRGGVDEWRKTPTVSRYFGGVRRGGC